MKNSEGHRHLLQTGNLSSLLLRTCGYCRKTHSPPPSLPSGTRDEDYDSREGGRTKVIRIQLVILVLLMVLQPLGGCSRGGPEKNGKQPPILQLGTLPVLQALPLFVAAEKGYFKEAGINVELVTFNSAMEKDVALSSGQIAGYFGDLMTPMVLAANGTNVKIVAENFNTPGDRRMFAVVVAPKYPKKDLRDIAAAGIASSSNTVLEYLMVRLLEAKKIPAGKMHLIEVKSIPIRFQMLVSNQVPAAILPEPLVTLAELKGGRIAVDDAGPGISATVLAFSDEYLAKYPETVKSFLAAIEKANDFINTNPDEVRPIMNRECKVPEPLQQSFAIPKFPKLGLPRSEEVMDVYRWLREKHIIKTEMGYGQIVAQGYVR